MEVACFLLLLKLSLLLLSLLLQLLLPLMLFTYKTHIIIPKLIPSLCCSRVLSTSSLFSLSVTIFFLFISLCLSHLSISLSFSLCLCSKIFTCSSLSLLALTELAPSLIQPR